MPAFLIMLTLTFASGLGTTSPPGCYWETRRAPKCAAYAEWVRSGPHRGEKFSWRGSDALPGALPEIGGH